MPYESALKTLPKTRQKVVSDAIQAWEHGSQDLRDVGRNLKKEVQLPQRHFVKLMRALAELWRSHPLDVIQTGRDYDTVCSVFLLSGPRVRGRAVQIGGRATPLRNYADDIFKYQLAKLPTGLSPKRLRATLRRLAAECAADSAIGATRVQSFLSAFKAPLEIARQPVWCTFLNPARDSSPFVPPLTSSVQIANALGLPYGEDCGEMLLFQYDASRLRVLVPTTVDAKRYRYFTPSIRTDEHGWTTPHDERKAGGVKQPEAVHKTLSGTVNGLLFFYAP